MDRSQPSSTISNKSVSSFEPVESELLLQRKRPELARQGVVKRDRLNLHKSAIKWISNNQARACQKRISSQPKTRADMHEKTWAGGTATGTSSLEEAPRTRKIPILAKRYGDSRATASLEHRYHVHSAAWRVYLPDSSNGLVLTVSPLKPTIKQFRGKLLHRGLRAGFGKLWKAGDIQHGPGSTIHKPELCRGGDREGNPSEHGWSRKGFRQCIHREALEKCEIRRGLPK